MWSSRGCGRSSRGGGRGSRSPTCSVSGASAGSCWPWTGGRSCRGRRRRWSSSAAWSTCGSSRRRASSTSAPAPARSRSRSRTSTRARGCSRSTTRRTPSRWRGRTWPGPDLADRVELRAGDLLAGVEGPFDLVVSNPPYVSPEEYPELQPEIRLYEPYEAVVGDHVWERIARAAPDVLPPGGRLVLECGDGQAAEVAKGLAALGYDGVLCTPDLAGRDRAVEGQRP